MTKILYLIPARAGSKGIKDKNLRRLTPDGPTLMERAFMTARECVKETGGDIRISTDIELPEESPLRQCVSKRPHWLCGDDCKMLPVVAHELTGNDYEIVVLLQPTSPFRKVHQIIAGINAVRNGKKTVLAIGDPKTHPAKLMTPEGGWAFPPFEQDDNRQDLPPYIEQFGTFYVANADHIRNGGGWQAGPVDTHRIGVTDIDAINIDKPYDLEVAEMYAERYGL